MSTLEDIENDPSPRCSNLYSPSVLSGEDDYKWFRITDFRQEDETGKPIINKEATEDLPVDKRPKLDEFIESEADLMNTGYDPRPKLDMFTTPAQPNKPGRLPPLEASDITTEDQEILSNVDKVKDSLDGMSDKMLRSLQRYRMNVGKILLKRSIAEEADHHRCPNVNPTPHAYEFGPPPIKEQTRWSSGHSLSPRDRRYSLPKFSRYASEANIASSLPLVTTLQSPGTKRDPVTPSAPFKLHYHSKAKKYHKATQVSLIQGSPIRILSSSGKKTENKSSSISQRQNFSSRMGISNIFKRKPSVVSSRANSMLSMRHRSSAAQFTFNMRQKQGSGKIHVRNSPIFDEDDELFLGKGDSYIHGALNESSSFDEKEIKHDGDQKSPKVLQKAKELARINKRARLGCCRLCWTDISSWWERIKSRREDNPFFSKQLKQVESHFGSGIMAFFLFLRWIFMLNVILAVFWCLFVIFPQMIYFDYSKQKSSFHVIHIITGGGPLGESWLFYGNYDEMIESYPLAFIYLISIIFTYFGGFFMVLKSLSVAVEDEGLHIRGKGYQMLRLLFSSWDYSLQSKEASKNLSMGLTHTFRFQKLQENQDKLLVGGGCSIIFVVLSSNVEQWARNLGLDVTSDSLIITYGPTIVFIIISGIVPEIVYLLPRFEKYSRGREEIHITIVRVFVLRIINILAMMISLQQKIKKNNFSGCAGTVIGQEMYKLVLIDTFVGIGTVMLPNTVKFLWYKKKVELEMPAQVLKILNRQALIWLGTLVCPLMPVIGMASTAIYFYTNYITVMKTCKPPEKRWNQPRRSSFFVGTTAATLIVVIALISFIIAGNDVVVLGEISYNSTLYCGPFLNNSITSVFDVWKQDVQEKNSDFGTFLQVITSGTVITPLLFVLLAVLYYQRLRIQWEERRNAVAFAELEQERELIKNVHVRDGTIL